MEKYLELNLIKNKITYIETRRQYARYSRMIFLLGALVLMAMIVNFVSISTKLNRSQKELAAMQSALEAKRTMFGLDDLEKEWRANCVKLKYINAMISVRSNWGVKLKDFANLLPAGMCITRIETSGNDSKVDFTVEIFALPNDKKGLGDIEAFISALEFNSLFGKGLKIESHERKEIEKCRFWRY